MNKENRIDWVDNVKTIGIFFVLLGHHKIDDRFLNWIYSFHMPLFFFLSGFLYNPSHYVNFRPFLIRKIKTLIVPYFFFAALSFSFWLIVVRNLSMEGASLRINPLMPFIGIFYGVGVGSWRVPLDTALWFLPCLFVVEILFWYIYRFFKGLRMLIALIISAIIGFGSSLYLPFRFPWGAEVALTALVFYGIGYLLKERILDWRSDKNLGIVMLITALFSILFGLKNGHVDMDGNTYGNIILFYVSAFGGILFLIGLSKLIPKNRVFSFIGQNTIVILGLSGVSLYIFRGIFYLFFHRLPELVNINIGLALILVVFQLLLLYPVIILLNNFFPSFLGRKRY